MKARAIAVAGLGATLLIGGMAWRVVRVWNTPDLTYPLMIAPNIAIMTGASVLMVLLFYSEHR